MSGVARVPHDRDRAYELEIATAVADLCLVQSARAAQRDREPTRAAEQRTGQYTQDVAAAHARALGHATGNHPRDAHATIDKGLRVTG